MSDVSEEKRAMIDTLVSVGGAALTTLARVAPDVAKAFTGGKPVAEAIEDAQKAVDELELRTDVGGRWDRDLRNREAGGEEPEG